MAEIVDALGWLEAFENGLECSDDILERSGRGTAEQRFDLGEGLLDRVEIGRVRRQVEQGHAGVFEALPDAGDFVGRQVIADHDTAGRQFGDEMIGQPLLEDASGHRPVDQHRRGDTVMAQRGDEGGGHPVTVRGFADQRLALAAPAAQPGHAGGRAGLVDEGEAGEVEPGLRCAPDLARYRDIGPVLLSGVDRPFFVPQPEPANRPPDACITDLEASSGQFASDLVQGQLGRRGQPLADPVRLFQELRAPVAAHRPRRMVALALIPPPPVARRARGNVERRADLPATPPRRHLPHYPTAQIIRIRLRHPMPASFRPA